MSNVSIEYNLTFENNEYILLLSISDELMKIHLERSDEAIYWKGEFESKYIEETTTKAGSYKSYTVFCKMFMSALSKESDSVFIDLLHYKQLEKLKMKKMSQSSGSFITSTNFNESYSSTNNNLTDRGNKFYLIMTYNSEFEKVHYPFPLKYCEEPEEEQFYYTISRLRKALNSNKNQNSTTINFKEIEEIKQENLNLKNKNKLLESQRKFGAVENEEFIRTYTSIKEEYDNYKQSAENKIKVLAKTVEDLKIKICSQNSNTNSHQDEQQIYIKELETKLEKASEIVITERKQGQSFMDEKIREIEKLQKDIHFMKENEKKLKVKINQLEKDLEIANRRNVYDSKKNHSATKSVYSNKSGSVRSGFSYNSKNSQGNSSTSNIKKNLLVNPYNKFKGLHSKNYSPFKFFDKKPNIKTNKTIKSNKSYNSNSSVRSTTSINSNKTGSIKKSVKITNKVPIKSLQKENIIGSNSNNTYSNSNKLSNNRNTVARNSSNNKQRGSITGSSSIKTGSNFSNGNIKTNIGNYNNEKTNLLVDKIKREKEKIALNAFNKIGPENSNNTKILSANEINERLGRIQNLLDSAKV